MADLKKIAARIASDRAMLDVMATYTNKAEILADFVKALEAWDEGIFSSAGDAQGEIAKRQTMAVRRALHEVIPRVKALDEQMWEPQQAEPDPA